ncbi:MAG: hypothetical protein MUE85_22545 [Microscillaceae bacterium]|jgi:hypothetical protein|nr:hypothetical protein [Microscillaceae bacterium]
MQNIIFFKPEDGDLISNPSAVFFEKIFLYESEDFWNIGAGMGYIDFINDKIHNRIEIVFEKSNGFYLRYKALNLDFHSIKAGNFEHKVKVYIGGNSITFPNIFFIDRITTLEAVKKFIIDGQMYRGITWLDDNKFEWDYESY